MALKLFTKDDLELIKFGVSTIVPKEEKELREFVDKLLGKNPYSNNGEDYTTFELNKEKLIEYLSNVEKVKDNKPMFMSQETKGFNDFEKRVKHYIESFYSIDDPLDRKNAREISDIYWELQPLMKEIAKADSMTIDEKKTLLKRIDNLIDIMNKDAWFAREMRSFSGRKEKVGDASNEDPYEAAIYKGREWGVYSKKSHTFDFFGTEKQMKEKAERLNKSARAKSDFYNPATNRWDDAKPMFMSQETKDELKIINEFWKRIKALTHDFILIDDIYDKKNFDKISKIYNDLLALEKEVNDAKFKTEDAQENKVEIIKHFSWLKEDMEKIVVVKKVTDEKIRTPFARKNMMSNTKAKPFIYKDYEIELGTVTDPDAPNQKGRIVYSLIKNGHKNGEDYYSEYSQIDDYKGYSLSSIKEIALVEAKTHIDEIEQKSLNDSEGKEKMRDVVYGVSVHPASVSFGKGGADYREFHTLEEAREEFNDLVENWYVDHGLERWVEITLTKTILEDEETGERELWEVIESKTFTLGDFIERVEEKKYGRKLGGIVKSGNDLRKVVQDYIGYSLQEDKNGLFRQIDRKDIWDETLEFLNNEYHFNRLREIDLHDLFDGSEQALEEFVKTYVKPERIERVADGKHKAKKLKIKIKDYNSLEKEGIEEYFEEDYPRFENGEQLEKWVKNNLEKDLLARFDIFVKKLGGWEKVQKAFFEFPDFETYSNEDLKIIVETILSDGSSNEWEVGLKDNDDKVVSYKVYNNYPEALKAYIDLSEKNNEEQYAYFMSNTVYISKALY